MMPMMGKTYSFTPIMGNYGNTEATWCKDAHSSLWATGACTKAASMLSVMGGKAKRWRGNRKQARCPTAELMALATLIYLLASKGSYRK